MLLFTLGTAPMLLALGFSSVKLLEKPRLSDMFLKSAGILILFFAVFNINSQLNVLGAASLNNVNLNSKTAAYSPAQQSNNLPPIINGKQVIKMEASSYGYNPNYFTIRVSVPVRWEIKDTGTSGCTDAVIAGAFFRDQIPLTRGKTSIKEFTPQKAGRYKFSCWMGMVWGVIDVVEGS